MFRNLILLFTITFLSGCTSMMQAVNADPTRVNVIGADEKDVVATVSLAANRRTMIVGLAGEGKGTFCAEPPPEVANNITSEVEAALKATVERDGLAGVDAEGNLKDFFKTTVVQLSERTALLDIYRTGTYSLCQYHLNGALSGTDLRDQFKNLTEAIINRLPKNELIDN